MFTDKKRFCWHLDTQIVAKGKGHFLLAFRPECNRCIYEWTQTQKRRLWSNSSGWVIDAQIVTCVVNSIIASCVVGNVNDRIFGNKFEMFFYIAQVCTSKIEIQQQIIQNNNSSEVSWLWYKSWKLFPALCLNMKVAI